MYVGLSEDGKTIVIGVLGGAAYLFGTQIDAELRDVFSRASAATATITKELQGSEGGRLLLAHIGGGEGFSIPSFLANVFSISASFLEAFVVTVIVGFYMAAQPQLYRSGFRQLFPRELRPAVQETLDDIAAGLRLWLVGELIQMVLIGVLSTVAVWSIGLPSPLALGVIAGVAEFIPYLGPVIAAIPALLVAMTNGTDTLWWTAIAYILIHQVEGNLVAPLIQRHMVFIPPAVMLLAIVALLFLFGGAAAIFAAPITVILFIAIKRLYLNDSDVLKDGGRARASVARWTA